MTSAGVNQDSSFSDLVVMDKLISDIGKYYSNKIHEHGATPRGIDWKDESSQIIRFDQLCQLLPHGAKISVNDLGCGYGALLDYLVNINQKHIEYYGYDISSEMVKTAKSLSSQVDRNLDHMFMQINNANDMKVSQYTLASGIFNVKLEVI